MFGDDSQPLGLLLQLSPDSSSESLPVMHARTHGARELADARTADDACERLSRRKFIGYILDTHLMPHAFATLRYVREIDAAFDTDLFWQDMLHHTFAFALEDPRSLPLTLAPRRNVFRQVFAALLDIALSLSVVIVRDVGGLQKHVVPLVRDAHQLRRQFRDTHFVTVLRRLLSEQRVFDRATILGVVAGNDGGEFAMRVADLRVQPENVDIAMVGHNTTMDLTYANTVTPFGVTVTNTYDVRPRVAHMSVSVVDLVAELFRQHCTEYKWPNMLTVRASSFAASLVYVRQHSPPAPRRLW